MTSWRTIQAIAAAPAGWVAVVADEPRAVAAWAVVHEYGAESVRPIVVVGGELVRADKLGMVSAIYRQGART